MKLSHERSYSLTRHRKGTRSSSSAHSGTTRTVGPPQPARRGQGTGLPRCCTGGAGKTRGQAGAAGRPRDPAGAPHNAQTGRRAAARAQRPARAQPRGRGTSSGPNAAARWPPPNPSTSTALVYRLGLTAAPQCTAPCPASRDATSWPSQCRGGAAPSP